MMHDVLPGKDVTSVPGSSSPTVRRRELGALLRALRVERGWTVEQVADRLMVSPSKVSRLETGQRGVSARDIRDLCDLYQVTEDSRQELIELAAEGKQSAWWQSRNLPYSTYVGLESDAASIRDFGLGLVPGLLQTADYGRAVLRRAHPELDEDAVELRLSGRIDRQRILTSPNPPRFSAVIDEAVLHRLPDNGSMMQVQLLRLLELSALPNVDIRIVPYAQGLLPSGNNKFIILTFSSAHVPSVVFIEGLTGDLYLDRPADVRAYERAFSELRAMAASEEQTRTMIAARLTGLGDD
jgi:transcriptional regulator with XRE-family HTH domain